MEAKDFVPLAGTLIGGLLAVAGGYFANLGLARQKEKAEAKATFRAKLEEVWGQMELCLEQVGVVHNRAVNIVDADCQVPSSDVADFEKVRSRLRMIVSLYFPGLSGPLAAFRTGAFEHETASRECAFIFATSPSRERRLEKVAELVTPKYTACLNLYKQFMDQVGVTAREYV